MKVSESEVEVRSVSRWLWFPGMAGPLGCFAGCCSFEEHCLHCLLSTLEQKQMSEAGVSASPWRKLLTCMFAALLYTLPVSAGGWAIATTAWLPAVFASAAIGHVLLCSPQQEGCCNSTVISSTGKQPCEKCVVAVCVVVGVVCCHSTYSALSLLLLNVGDHRLYLCEPSLFPWCSSMASLSTVT